MYRIHESDLQKDCAKTNWILTTASEIEIVSFLSLVVEKVGEEVLVVDDHQNIQSVF